MKGNDDVRFYIVLLIIQIILSIIYAVYIIIDERKKWQKREFFKYTLYYEMDYFLLHLYTLAIIVISIGVLALIPMDFSKCNRMYKLFGLFTKFMFKNRNYYFYKD